MPMYFSLYVEQNKEAVLGSPWVFGEGSWKCGCCQGAATVWLERHRPGGSCGDREGGGRWQVSFVDLCSPQSWWGEVGWGIGPGRCKATLLKLLQLIRACFPFGYIYLPVVVWCWGHITLHTFSLSAGACGTNRVGFTYHLCGPTKYF